jgi:hypothetical protein
MSFENAGRPTIIIRVKRHSFESHFVAMVPRTTARLFLTRKLIRRGPVPARR